MGRKKNQGGGQSDADKNPNQGQQRQQDQGPPRNAGQRQDRQQDQGPPRNAGQRQDRQQDQGPPRNAGQRQDRQQDQGPPQNPGQRQDQQQSQGPPRNPGQRQDQQQSQGPPRNPGQRQDQQQSQGQKQGQQSGNRQDQRKDYGQQKPQQHQDQGHQQSHGQKQGQQSSSRQQKQQDQGQQQNPGQRQDQQRSQGQKQGQQSGSRQEQRKDHGQQKPTQQQSAGASSDQQQPGPSASMTQNIPTSSQEPKMKQRSDSVQSKTESVHSKPDSETETVTSSVSELSLTKQYIPSKASMTIATAKQPGTKGQKLFIETNYIKLDLQKLVSKAYHYDVDIEPNMPKRLMTTVFEKFRHENFPNSAIAYDGRKNAVTSAQIKIPANFSKKIKIIDPENAREREYTVKIKETRDLVLDFGSLRTYQQSRQYDAPLRALQFFEIVMKAAFLNKPGVQVGRSFFQPLSNPIDLGDAYDLWTGLFQSVVLGAKPYLNVDIAHKAFPAPVPILECFAKLGISNPNAELRPYDKDALRKHLKGLCITYSPPGTAATKSIYKFNDLGDNAKQHKFKNDAGQMVSVYDYFLAKKWQIKFPHLPLLNVGNTVRAVRLPMEFCSITAGQAVNKKCTEKQTTKMIREAATSTDVRKNKIMDMLKRINHNSSQVIKQFGIGVGNEFTEIPARILNPPDIVYARDRVARPRNGQWRAENYHFLNPKNLVNWALLVVDQRTNVNSVHGFANMIVQQSKTLNMDISPNYDVVPMDRNYREQDIETKMRQFIQNKVEILFVIIPDQGPVYAQIKQNAEIKCGILTQCIRSQTIYKKGNDISTINNILLKVNAKLNGTNHKISTQMLIPAIQKQPYMIIGADVTHPSPDQTAIPSVVGVAASNDIHAFRYNMCWRLQNPKQEMIQDLDQIIEEQIIYFQNTVGGAKKTLPQKILYYRDGVSEGQFQEVLNVEYMAMCRAFQKFGLDYKPAVTFIVVQKRHHTRFFPGKSGCGRDDRRNNNVPPGLIVDTEITHPNETQFFLVSHQSIQGVAKPTKYCLLKDDSNLTMDDLQALTYNLCHMFTRCNRSVSYPAPTYYAHLAAFRGRVYIEGKRINMDKLDKEYKSLTIKENIIKGHSMYFV